MTTGIGDQRVECTLKQCCIRKCEWEGTAALKDSAPEKAVVSASVCHHVRVDRNCASSVVLSARWTHFNVCGQAIRLSK